MIITRFAPSPTGMLHIGSARTALFNYLFAKVHNGIFRLRIEDTDAERSYKEAEQDIFDGLKWLGLDYSGDIIYQSQRQDRYSEIVNQLLINDCAYKCYCTNEELNQIREYQRNNKQHLAYDGRCRNKHISDDRPFVVRMKIPRDGQIIIQDLVQKKVIWNNNTIEDFIIARSDGSATYMLSVVVDDHDMNITHVIRGDDHLINTPKQLFIYQGMDWHYPQFAHIPLIHGMDGSKLSKRHGAVSLTKYQDIGFLPEAMNNMLLRLGWAYGNEEIISMKQAIQWFTIDKINKSAAKFDLNKLISLNKYYLKNINNDNLIKLITNYSNYKFNLKELRRINYILPEIKIRCSTLIEVNQMLEFIKDNDMLDTDHLLDYVDFEILVILHRELSKVIIWNKDNLQTAINNILKYANIDMNKLSQNLRIALVGSKISTGIYDFMMCLGRYNSLQRLNNLQQKPNLK